MDNKDIEYAGMLKRLLAIVIDYFLIILFSIVIYIILPHGNAKIIWMFLAGFVCILYFIELHHRFGRTLGKWICRIKVINSDNGKLTYSACIKRVLLFIPFLALEPARWFYLIDLLIGRGSEWDNSLANVLFVYLSNLLFFIIVYDCCTLYINQERKTIHDRFANTIVIRK